MKRNNVTMVIAFFMFTSILVSYYFYKTRVVIVANEEAVKTTNFPRVIENGLPKEEPKTEIKKEEPKVEEKSEPKQEKTYSIVQDQETSVTQVATKPKEEKLSKVEKSYGEFIQDSSFGEIEEDRFSNYWGEENLTKLGGGTIKVKYPAGSYKPSASPRGGAGFIYRMPNGQEKYTLNFDLELADNFQFVRGGKLPGLCGGDCPTGGEMAVNGFSTSFVWKKDGNLDVASIIPGAKKYGSYTGQKFAKLSPGGTYNIKQEITLNTPGASDGKLVVYVNSKEVYRKEDIVFRSNPSVKIDGFIFNTFFGGGDPSWATPNETHITFSDFKLIK